MHKVINSISNPRIKNLIALRKASVRKEQGVTLVDGVKEMQTAVKCGLKIKEVYYLKKIKGFENIINKADQIYEINDSVSEKISYGERNEGIVAVVVPPQKKLNQLKLQNNPLCVVLENVEKPGNLGAILRTCDGVGVDAVFVCDQKTDIYNPNAIRASLGTIFSIEVISASSDEVISYLKRNKISICATTPEAKKIYNKADLRSATAVAMGEEHRGLTEKWLNAADIKVSIPMAGVADSLNVSVSTAVILYEALRQRNN